MESTESLLEIFEKWCCVGSRVCVRPPVMKSLKRGDQNIILTASEKFFERFVAATSIATRLNLFVKKDRIALFQAVLYANPDKEYSPKIEPSVTADELQAAAGL